MNQHVGNAKREFAVAVCVVCAPSGLES